MKRGRQHRTARDVFLAPALAESKNRSLPAGFAWLPVGLPLNGTKRVRRKTNKVVQAEHEAVERKTPRLGPNSSKKGRRIKTFASKRKQLLKDIDKFKEQQTQMDDMKTDKIAEIDKRIKVLETRLKLLKLRQGRMAGQSAKSQRKASKADRKSSPHITPSVPMPSPFLADLDEQRRSRRSNRVIKTPNKLNPNELVKLTEPLRKCQALLKHLMTRQGSELFHRPVDYVALNLIDYPKKIKNPMDLGTIQTRLKGGHYGDIDTFAIDVRLVWSNCMKYNVVGDWVYNKAKELSALFETRFAKIPKFVKPRPRSTKKKKSGGTAPSSQSEVARLKEQIEVLERNVERLAKPGPGGAASAKKRKLNTPLTPVEKRVLRDNIHKLPPGKLGKIIDIIRQYQKGSQADDDEIVVDMDQLSTPALRELQKYVEGELKKISKKRPRSSTPSQVRPSPKRPSILESPLADSHASNPSPRAQPMNQPKANGKHQAGSDSDSSSSSDSDSSDSDSSHGPNLQRPSLQHSSSFSSSYSSTFQNPPPPV